MTDRYVFCTAYGFIPGDEISPALLTRALTMKLRKNGLPDRRSLEVREVLRLLDEAAKARAEATGATRKEMFTLTLKGGGGSGSAALEQTAPES